jgi:DNA polymerase-3 subunit epsilon
VIFTVLWGVVDTETTGLTAADHAISLGVLIAEVDHSGGTITCLDSIYTLIRIPDPSMAEQTKFIHGISQEEVEGAPVSAEVCMKFLDLKRRHRFSYIAAWNHRFDRRYLEKLFALAGIPAPAVSWVEMQPAPYAKLDTHACQLRCGEIRSLPGHNALNDCVRALGVYAEHNRYDLDMPSLIRAIRL